MSKRKTVFKGKVFTVQQYPASHGRIFETCIRQPSVEIIPITEEGKIIITKQVRPHYPSGIYSFPGGKVDADEDLITAAQRELQEEIGYKANSMELFSENCKMSTLEYDISVYIARDIIKSKLPHDIDEKISIEEKTLNEVLELTYAEDMFMDINSVAAYKLFYAVQKGDIKL